MKMNLDQLDVHNFLPHRAPMLMVDKLLTLTKDTVSSSFSIDEDCPFVNASGNLSEIGLIENNAQTCSSIVGQIFFAEDDIEGTSAKVLGFISVIKKANIYSLPKVSDTIITKASLISRLKTGEFIMCTMKTSSFNNEELIVDCTMNLIIREV
jgi:predicted hotdog family 3-hydroxylacyl-ACP dehydratase